MLLPILLLLVPLSSATSTKLIIIWGSPVQESSPFGTSSNWDDCIAECLNNDTCLAIEKTSSGGCNLFRVGDLPSIQRLDSSSGKRVAFKVTLEDDTCPPSVPDFTSPSSYSYPIGSTVQVTMTEETVTFQVATCSSSEDQLSTRDGCLRVQFFPTCANHIDAITLCQSIGSVISGPASQQESDWLIAKVTKSLLMQGAPEKASASFVGIWIDGVSSTSSGDFVMEDSTHSDMDFYQFTKDKSKDYTDKCMLYMPSIQDINADVCTLQADSLSIGVCMRGALCMSTA